MLRRSSYESSSHTCPPPLSSQIKMCWWQSLKLTSFINSPTSFINSPVFQRKSHQWQVYTDKAEASLVWETRAKFWTLEKQVATKGVRNCQNKKRRRQKKGGWKFNSLILQHNRSWGKYSKENIIDLVWRNAVDRQAPCWKRILAVRTAIIISLSL